MSQAERGEAFRRLHEGPGAFVIPNPWDAGSAKVLAGLGFEALATTSSGAAFTLGKRDAEGAVTREEALKSAGAIVSATPLPVSADRPRVRGGRFSNVSLTLFRRRRSIPLRQSRYALESRQATSPGRV